MKLNRRSLRKMILKEFKLMTESQKSVGLPHVYSNMELVRHTKNFMQEMSAKYGKVIPYSTPDYKKGEFLLKIVHNATQQAVKNRENHLYDDEYNIIEPFTTDEETEYMRQEQGDLRMVRNALANLLGMSWKYSGGGRREDLSQRMRELDPHGKRQKFGNLMPSDDPELRKNMPAYQPGGRFYDPDDIIHKK